MGVAFVSQISDNALISLFLQEAPEVTTRACSIAQEYAIRCYTEHIKRSALIYMKENKRIRHLMG